MSSTPPANNKLTFICSIEKVDEALLNGISARTVPDLSIRSTGNVSKKAGILLTVTEIVPLVIKACPTQLLTIPSDRTWGPDLNRPPFDGLHPI